MFDIFKKQFIEVIEWTEESDGVLSYRFPTLDKEIQSGAQLTVRDSQMALFVNEGNVADCFSPGRYSLTTQNMPIMTTLMNWDKAFKSPFKSEVYFFSTREGTLEGPFFTRFDAEREVMQYISRMQQAAGLFARVAR